MAHDDGARNAWLQHNLRAFALDGRTHAEKDVRDTQAFESKPLEVGAGGAGDGAAWPLLRREPNLKNGLEKQPTIYPNIEADISPKSLPHARTAGSECTPAVAGRHKWGSEPRT